MPTKTLRDKIQKIASFKGVEVLRTEFSRGSGTHVKIYCRYKGEKFFILSSAAQSSDLRGDRNLMQNVRGAMRAIDTGDATLRGKYLSPH